MTPARILDFDGSVLPLPGAKIVSLRDRQEEIRLGCRMRTLRSLGAAIPAEPSITFMGSGDFHHVTFLCIERLAALGNALQVVVFDNHPDNMRYPFGIHCGSWVAHVSRLPFIARIHVVGIASRDVEGIHVAENHLRPLRSGKVIYWCIGRNLRGLQRFGVRASRSFASPPELLAEFQESIAGTREPLYVSVDKDVLAPDVAQTNWDQGVMRLEDVTSTVAAFGERIVAGDVVGDVSLYRYRSRFKRMLSRLDRQPDVDAARIGEWQQAHAKINRELLAVLSRGPR